MNPPAQEIEALYLQAPTPEFRQALDLAVAPLQGAAGEVLALVSSPFYAVEVLRRVTRPLVLAGSPGFELQPWLEHLRAWSWAEVQALAVGESGAFQAILWAEPQRPSSAKLAAWLRQVAAPGASLSVIASTGLRRFLPAWQGASRPATDPLPAAQLSALLRQAGWQPAEQCGFHGPRSVGWTLLMRLAEALGRPDWADRARFGMRNSFIEIGWVSKYCPLNFIRAQV